MQTLTATDDTTTSEAWPAGITARILTRAAILTNDRNATVDIYDTTSRSIARCRPCGWSEEHGSAYRNTVVTAAQGHADRCTALARPAAA